MRCAARGCETAGKHRLHGTMGADAAKQRVLVFIVAYNAETTIGEVLARIPAQLDEDYELELLVIDDASQGRTFELGAGFRQSNALPFPLTVRRTPDNEGC